MYDFLKKIKRIFMSKKELDAEHWEFVPGRRPTFTAPFGWVRTPTGAVIPKWDDALDEPEWLAIERNSGRYTR